MPNDCITYQNSGYFSKLIVDYLDQKPELDKLYNRFPKIENLKFPGFFSIFSKKYLLANVWWLKYLMKWAILNLPTIFFLALLPETQVILLYYLFMSLRNKCLPILICRCEAHGLIRSSDVCSLDFSQPIFDEIIQNKQYSCHRGLHRLL